MMILPEKEVVFYHDLDYRKMLLLKNVRKTGSNFVNLFKVSAYGVIPTTGALIFFHCSPFLSLKIMALLANVSNLRDFTDWRRV